VSWGFVPGNSAFLIAFEIGGDQFKVIWPVLPTKTKKERAAKIQAATFLYHDIKAKCLSATILGARMAFFSYLLLSDGRMAAELSDPEMTENWPRLFAPPSQRALGAGNDIVEGEYR